MIPYSRQSIDDEDVAAVVDALRSDWITTGPAIERFEHALREVTEAEHAVVFSSGTAALHAAVAAAGLGPDDRVAVPTMTFSATAACVRYVGGHPVLLDIDSSTMNVDPGDVPDGVDAFIPVHFAGLPVDLSRLSRRPRVVIEDACHALGASTPDGPVGNCARSDMCCFSFHPVKPITTAEGGCVTTNDAALAAALRRFRNHGIEPHPERGGWVYEVTSLGFNYRLTDLQAALGTSQLRKLHPFRERRQELADRYRAELAALPVELPPAAPNGSVHALHLFPIRVDGRDRVYATLRERGIGVQVHYIPLHRHPIYAPYAAGLSFPAAETLYGRVLSLPLHQSMTDTDLDVTISALAGAIRVGT